MIEPFDLGESKEPTQPERASLLLWVSYFSFLSCGYPARQKVMLLFEVVMEGTLLCLLPCIKRQILDFSGDVVDRNLPASAGDIGFGKIPHAEGQIRPMHHND